MPVDHGLVFIAKALANAFVLIALAAITWPAYALLFGHDLIPFLAPLSLVIVLGVIGFAAAGTLLSFVGGHGRGREVLLPVLLFPILIPWLMMTIQATQRILEGATLWNVASELQLLAAYDTIFLVLGWLVADYLLGE